MLNLITNSADKDLVGSNIVIWTTTPWTILEIEH